MRHDGTDLYVIGISHECASPETLGFYAVPADKCVDAQRKILDIPSVSEALVLSTCNRVEVYFCASDAAARSQVLSALSESGDTFRDMSVFARSAYVKKNAEAAAHLFEIASGLRSRMAGETEILGQVKAAYARAESAGHCSKILNTVFQKAAQCAKWIRTNTEIGRGKISLGSVGAELAARIFEDVSQAKILLLGSGEAGRAVAEALYVRGAHDITVASRTRENANTLAEKIGCLSDDMSDVLARLADFDIAVSASFSPEPLVSARMVADAIAARSGRPMFLIDLGVPRNMAKECADIEDAYLYTLDDLSKIADENAAARRSEIESAAKIAREKALYTSEKLFPENNSDAAQLAGGIAFNNLLVKFDTNTKNHH